jgi:hypothetical protein
MPVTHRLDQLRQAQKETVGLANGGRRNGSALLALTILSPKGQKIMAQRGFRPATLPSD